MLIFSFLSNHAATQNFSKNLLYNYAWKRTQELLTAYFIFHIISCPIVKNVRQNFIKPVKLILQKFLNTVPQISHFHLVFLQTNRFLFLLHQTVLMNMQYSQLVRFVSSQDWNAFPINHYLIFFFLVNGKSYQTFRIRVRTVTNFSISLSCLQFIAINIIILPWIFSKFLVISVLYLHKLRVGNPISY